MKILITGGFGYVGGRLAEYLSDHRSDSDIFLTTTRDDVPSWGKNYTVVKMNVMDLAEMSSCLEWIRPDVVIHLAGLSQQMCEEDAYLAECINIEGTASLLKACKRVNIKKFIYLSTIQVYGSFDILEHIVTEKTLCRPNNVYAKTKCAAEYLVEQFSDSFQTIVLRLSNAFGAPMDLFVSDSVWQLVFSAFCLKALRDQCIKPRGNSYRNFIPMADVVRGIDHMLFELSEGMDHRVFNLGSINTMSLLDVAQLLARTFKQKENKDVDVVCGLKEEGHYFKYSTERIQETGFVYENDIEGELIRLIGLCKEKDKIV